MSVFATHMVLCHDDVYDVCVHWAPTRKKQENAPLRTNEDRDRKEDRDVLSIPIIVRFRRDVKRYPPFRFGECDDPDVLQVAWSRPSANS